MTIPKNDQRGFYHYEPGATKICGSFQVVAGPAIGLVTGNQGNNFAVTRTGVGDYLVTLGAAFTQMVCATATVQNAANNVDMYAQIGTITMGAIPTVQIRTKTIGANTEIPANDRCHFEFTLRSEWT